MLKSRVAFAVLCGLSLVVFLATDAWACPNCKDSLAQNDPSAGGLVRGYFWSILFLLATPFTILTSLSVYFYCLVRQARAAAATAPEGNPFAVGAELRDVFPAGATAENSTSSLREPAEEMLV